MTPASPSLYLERPGPVQRFWGLFRQAGLAAFEDNCFGIAKGAAYSSLLAFFPVLASLAAILASVNASAVERVFSRLLFQVIPPGTEDLVRSQFTVRNQRSGWLILLATLLSIWAASGAMMTLMEGFQAAYRLPSGRPFLKQRSVAILAGVHRGGAGGGLVGTHRLRRAHRTMDAGGAGPGAGRRLAHLRDPDLWLAALRGGAGGNGACHGVDVLHRPQPDDAVPAAYGPAQFWRRYCGCWLHRCLALYVRHIARYNVLYGSIGAVIALLVWMYLLAVIALFGCEYNAVRERLLD